MFNLIKFNKSLFSSKNLTNKNPINIKIRNFENIQNKHLITKFCNKHKNEGIIKQTPQKFIVNRIYNYIEKRFITSEKNADIQFDEKKMLEKIKEFQLEKKSENFMNLYYETDIVLKNLRKNHPEYKLVIDVNFFLMGKIQDKEDILKLKNIIKENPNDLDNDLNLLKALNFNLVNIWRIFSVIEKNPKNYEFEQYNYSFNIGNINKEFEGIQINYLHDFSYLRDNKNLLNTRRPILNPHEEIFNDDDANILPIHLQAIKKDIYCNYAYEIDYKGEKIITFDKRFRLSEFIKTAFNIAEILLDKIHTIDSNINAFPMVLFEIYKLYTYYSILSLNNEETICLNIEKLKKILNNFSIDSLYEYSLNFGIFLIELTKLNKQSQITEFLNIYESKLHFKTNTSETELERMIEIIKFLANYYINNYDREKSINIIQKSLGNLNLLINKEIENKIIGEDFLYKSILSLSKFLSSLYGNINEESKAKILCQKALKINDKLNDIYYIYNIFELNYFLACLATRPSLILNEFLFHLNKIKQIFSLIFDEDDFKTSDGLKFIKKDEIDLYIQLEAGIDNKFITLIQKIIQIKFLNHSEILLKEIKRNTILGYMQLIYILIKHREYINFQTLEEEDMTREEEIKMEEIIRKDLIFLYGLLNCQIFDDDVELTYVIDWKIILFDYMLNYSYFEEGIKLGIDLLNLNHHNQKVKELIYFENIEEPIQYIISKLIEFSIFIANKDLKNSYEKIVKLYKLK